MKKFFVLTSVFSLALSIFAVGEASASLASPSSTQVPSVLTCAGKTVIRPSNYVLACADANTYFNSVHWTSWTKTSATATATFVENNCVPTCAGGKFIKYPAKLTLSKPKPTKLGVLFSVVHYSFTVSRSTTLPLATLSSVR